MKLKYDFTFYISFTFCDCETGYLTFQALTNRDVWFPGDKIVFMIMVSKHHPKCGFIEYWESKFQACHFLPQKRSEIWHSLLTFRLLLRPQTNWQALFAGAHSTSWLYSVISGILGHFCGASYCSVWVCGPIDRIDPGRTSEPMNRAVTRPKYIAMWSQILIGYQICHHIRRTVAHRNHKLDAQTGQPN